MTTKALGTLVVTYLFPVFLQLSMNIIHRLDSLYLEWIEKMVENVEVRVLKASKY